MTSPLSKALLFLIGFSVVMETLMFLLSGLTAGQATLLLTETLKKVSLVASELRSEYTGEIQGRLRVMEETEAWVYGALQISHREIEGLNEANLRLETEHVELQKKLEHAKAENLKLKAALQGSKKRPQGPTLSLLVATLTSPRIGADYLAATTFRQLHNQLKEIDPELGDVRSLVVNSRPGAHAGFERLREQHQEFSFHTFLEREGSLPPPQPGENKAEEEAPLFGGNITAAQVRLNADLVGFLRATADHCSENRLGFVLLMEDDFEWCPGALLQALNAIRRAESSAQQRWIAIRTSVGLNGIILHCQDLPSLISVGEMKGDSVPLDSLFGGIWANAKEVFGREYLIYRYNLFHHIGKISAKGGEHGVQPDQGALFTKVPGCFELIKYIGLFPAEYFQDSCLDQTFTPCEKG